jgi:hypothetical protein
MRESKLFGDRAFLPPAEAQMNQGQKRKATEVSEGNVRAAIRKVQRVTGALLLYRNLEGRSG